MRRDSKVFVDTNILIYAADSSEPAKHKTAQKVVRKLRQDGNGVISTQVMKEFFNVASRKLGLPPIEAKELTMTLTSFEVISTTPGLVEKAMDLTILHRLSFWNAMILAAASQGRCAKVLTEDFQSQSTIAGVLIESPF